MSADFARIHSSGNTMLTQSIFDFRVDCSREIDFEFFDAAPSSPLSLSQWETRPNASEISQNHLRSQSSSPTFSTASNEDNDVITCTTARVQGPGCKGDVLQKEDGHRLSPHTEQEARDAEVTHPGQKSAQSGCESIPVAPSCASPNHGLNIKGRTKHHSGEPEQHEVCDEIMSSDRQSIKAGKSLCFETKNGGDVLEQDTPHVGNSPCPGEAPLGVTDLVIVPKRHASATSSMTAVSSAPTCGSSEESSPEDSGEVGVAILTRALRCLRPSSSTRSYASSTLSKRSQSSRINMSFSNDEARRIQRENEILLRRIVAQKARVPVPVPASPQPQRQSARSCSHAINRARRSRDIQRENEILLKKIQAVKRSSSQMFMTCRSSSSMSGRV